MFASLAKMAVRASCFAVLAILAMASPSRASFDEGVAAYSRGDYRLARREFESDSSPESLFYLGRMAELGQGVAKDSVAARRYYDQASRGGFVKSRQPLGARGRFYRAAAEKGDPYSQTKLAVMYLSGDGAPQDSDEGERWLLEAAGRGYPPAQYELYQLYAGSGSRRNLEGGLKWLHKAAASGSVEALNSLAQRYYTGDAVGLDKSESARLYMQAATLGSVGAAYSLGTMYVSGDGVDVDLCKAARLFDFAARGGDPEAQAMLGFFYDSGWCVSRNRPAAAAWYERAARGGSSQGQYNLGVMLMKGELGPTDRDAALALFEKAAAGGSAEAREAIRRLNKQKREE